LLVLSALCGPLPAIASNGATVRPAADDLWVLASHSSGLTLPTGTRPSLLNTFARRMSAGPIFDQMEAVVFHGSRVKTDGTPHPDSDLDVMGAFFVDPPATQEQLWQLLYGPLARRVLSEIAKRERLPFPVQFGVSLRVKLSQALTMTVGQILGLDPKVYDMANVRLFLPRAAPRVGLEQVRTVTNEALILLRQTHETPLWLGHLRRYGYHNVAVAKGRRVGGRRSSAGAGGAKR
jgi:hypothetical protein